MSDHPTDDHALLDQLAASHFDMHRRQLAGLEIPADLRRVVIDPAINANGIVRDQSEKKRPTLSYGIINPTTLTIFWGVDGGTPSAASRALSQPPKSLMVLPIQVGEVQIGVDPVALGASVAVLFVLRFETVQPVFLGAS